MRSTLTYFAFILAVFLSNKTIAQDDNSCPKTENKKAIRAYQDGLDKWADARSGKGTHKDYLEAIQCFKKAIELEPDFADAFYSLGELHYKLQNAKLAEENLQKAYDICPNFPDLNLYYYLSGVYMGKEKWSDAEKYLTIYLKDTTKIKSSSKKAEAKSWYKSAKFNAKIYGHPVPFSPKPVDLVCTKANEYLPSITADGEFIYFTRNYDINQGRDGVNPDGRIVNVERFSMAKKTSETTFEEGAALPPPFNLTSNEGGATLTIDNRYLFYSVTRVVNGYRNTDICMSENIDGEWTEVKNLGEVVNLPDSWDSQPTVSADGKTIYFTSDRPGGLGGLDIWKTTKNANGEWTKPVNLGSPINTPGNEKSPFMHTDSQTLYFTSSDREEQDKKGNTIIFPGHEGLGGYDIFYAKMNDDGSWQTPTNIGYPINSKDDENGFIVSTDGKTGYFASNKPELGGKGGWDLYSFDLYKEARPDRVLFLKGDIKDDKTNTPIRAKVELTNAKTKEITEVKVDSTTGKYVVAMKFKDDYVMTVKKDGYAYNAKYIAKEDSVYEAPKKMDFDVQKITVGQSYKLNDIYYATNSSELAKSSSVIIEGFVEFLKKNPTIHVAIHGHTDNVGDDAANMTLSQERAKSVYNFMVSKGLDAKRLSFEGHGASRPVATNDTAAGRALNRRTEFQITSK